MERKQKQMILYTAKNIKIDSDSLELIYFYIPKYTVFSNFGITLHPQYNIKITEHDFDKEKLILSITKKKEFVDLFSKEKISLKLICGKNGCGKTTLLKLLSGEIQVSSQHKREKSISQNNNLLSRVVIGEPDTRYDCIYIFKDKNENFASSKEIKIILDKNVQIELNSTDNHITLSQKLICVTHKNMGIEDFILERNIVEYYYRFPKIFDGILNKDVPLFNNFCIKLWRFNEYFEDLLSSNVGKFLKSYDEYKINLGLSLESNWLLYYYMNTLRDVQHEKFLYEIEQQLKEDNSFDFFEILELSLSNENSILYDEIENEIKKLQNKTYNLQEFQQAETDLINLDKKMNKLISSSLGVDRSITFHFRNFVYFEGFYKNDNVRRNFYDLSTGEYLKFKYRYEIFHSIYQKERIFWYIDEPENGLHPEWCRSFINNYLKAYRDIKNIVEKNKKYLTDGFHFNKDKRILIILSTHSPFLLTDVTNNYISYLEKDEALGITEEITNLKNTFAGNIGELFTENFFMEKTIGEYASKLLENIIIKLNSSEPLPDKLYAEYKKIIDCIGDNILHILSSEKLERKHATNKIE